MIGVRGDFSLEVRHDAKGQVGISHAAHTMLLDLAGQKLLLPKRRRDRPNPARLAKRYKQFLEASAVDRSQTEYRCGPRPASELKITSANEWMVAKSPSS